jgi:hypothetical protein
VITFLNTRSALFSMNQAKIVDAGSYSWSTLLLPTLVQWPVATSGTELDLGSVAFVNQLSTDLRATEANSGMSLFRSHWPAIVGVLKRNRSSTSTCV